MLSVLVPGDKMAISNLYNKMDYIMAPKYSINRKIREYDLSKANISALLWTGRISESEYNQYLVMDKNTRERLIGLAIGKDKSIYDSIQEGIIYAKKQLFETNGLEDKNIVSIHNDAVFVRSNNPLPNVQFGPFIFNIKNQYTTYMRLDKLEVYFIAEEKMGEVSIKIDIKGLGDNVIESHRNGMMDVISKVCYFLECGNIVEAIEYMNITYRDFAYRQLPLTFYRSFDNDNAYVFNTPSQVIKIPNELGNDPSLVRSVDISRNLFIMRELMYIIQDVARSISDRSKRY